MARYGRVSLTISYVVDLDDSDMVSDATDAIADDIRGMDVDDVFLSVKREADTSLGEGDIEEFLVQYRADRNAE